jgi:hypothetical protein
MLQDGNYDSYNMRMFSYLARGIYADQLSRWFEHFPRKQFLLLKSEDFFANPENSYTKTLDFLELPAHKLITYKKFNASVRESMPNGIRQYLTDYFKPHNEHLKDLTGTSFSWQPGTD